MEVYRIVDWSKNFENNRTRELGELRWVPVPNRHDGDRYRTLMSRPDCFEVFGAWNLILQVASKCRPRGTLVRSNGDPHTPETISGIVGGSPKKLRNALEVLCQKDIGWIEKLATSYEELDIPKEFSQADQKRAHGRVNRHLAKGEALYTPVGLVTSRPLVCQWCEKTPAIGGRDFPGVVAHHPIGYGNHESDLSVIFVCRSCHGFFESEKITTSDIFSRFGHNWIASVAKHSHSGATQSRSGASVRAGAQNGMERMEMNVGGVAPVSRFIPPSVPEVAAYCTERGNAVDPEKFVDHYSAKGWMIGKSKMKDWRAAVRTWEPPKPKSKCPNFEDLLKPGVVQ